MSTGNVYGLRIMGTQFPGGHCENCEASKGKGSSTPITTQLKKVIRTENGSAAPKKASLFDRIRAVFAVFSVFASRFKVTTVPHKEPEPKMSRRSSMSSPDVCPLSRGRFFVNGDPQEMTPVFKGAAVGTTSVDSLSGKHTLSASFASTSADSFVSSLGLGGEVKSGVRGPSTFTATDLCPIRLGEVRVAGSTTNSPRGSQPVTEMPDAGTGDKSVSEVSVSPLSDKRTQSDNKLVVDRIDASISRIERSRSLRAAIHNMKTLELDRLSIESYSNLSFDMLYNELIKLRKQQNQFDQYFLQFNGDVKEGCCVDRIERVMSLLKMNFRDQLLARNLGQLSDSNQSYDELAVNETNQAIPGLETFNAIVGISRDKKSDRFLSVLTREILGAKKTEEALHEEEKLSASDLSKEIVTVTERAEALNLEKEKLLQELAGKIAELSEVLRPQTETLESFQTQLMVLEQEVSHAQVKRPLVEDQAVHSGGNTQPVQSSTAPKRSLFGSAAIKVVTTAVVSVIAYKLIKANSSKIESGLESILNAEQKAALLKISSRLDKAVISASDLTMSTVTAIFEQLKLTKGQVGQLIALYGPEIKAIPGKVAAYIPTAEQMKGIYESIINGLSSAKDTSVQTILSTLTSARSYVDSQMSAVAHFAQPIFASSRAFVMSQYTGAQVFTGGRLLPIAAGIAGVGTVGLLGRARYLRSSLQAAPITGDKKEVSVAAPVGKPEENMSKKRKALYTASALTTAGALAYIAGNVFKGNISVKSLDGFAKDLTNKISADTKVLEAAANSSVAYVQQNRPTIASMREFLRSLQPSPEYLVQLQKLMEEGKPELVLRFN